MAILYGTQSNGETLPVQVNSFGQLVAQGLDGATGEKGDKGDQGPQGPQGEQGPAGVDAGFEWTTWTPTLTFSGDGAAVQDIQSASGRKASIAGLEIISFQIRWLGISITNAAGAPLVGGFGTGIGGSAQKPERMMGFMGRHDFFGPALGVYPRTDETGEYLEFYQRLKA